MTQSLGMQNIQAFLDDYYLVCKKHNLEINSDFAGALVVEPISIFTKGLGFHANAGEYYVEELK